MMHTIFNIPLEGEIPENAERVLFGMGCFWGVERLFWQFEGVYRTTVGYAGGHVDAPDYKSVCNGTTGHSEVVEVVYFPEQISFEQLMVKFWENHDPTQGNRQGNDIGSQYRSLIGAYTEQQMPIVDKTLTEYQTKLTQDGYGEISTELCYDLKYWLAEEYHQQYLDKNPAGYCGLAGTGTCFI